MKILTTGLALLGLMIGCAGNERHDSEMERAVRDADFVLIGKPVDPQPAEFGSYTIQPVRMLKGDADLGKVFDLRDSRLLDHDGSFILCVKNLHTSPASSSQINVTALRHPVTPATEVNVKSVEEMLAKR